MTPAIYVQANDASDNEIVAFSRSEEGQLAPLGRYSTGGRGTGEPHLPSQNSIVLSDDGRWLLVANSGSDDLSLFAIESDGLRLEDRVDSGGSKPTSVAVSGELVYVLNNGTPCITGFNLSSGKLTPLEDSTRQLSAEDADPAQISFSVDGAALIATERGTNSISSYAIDERGYAEGPTTIESKGETPYGFDFTPKGSLIVTEAFGGAAGAAAASSYAVAGGGELTRGQRLGWRHPQRGLLGRGDEGRPVRLCHQLRRLHRVVLRDRRRRKHRAARSGGRLDPPR